MDPANAGQPVHPVAGVGRPLSRSGSGSGSQDRLLETRFGAARIVTDWPADPRGLLVLLHGAGTSTDVPVLLQMFAQMRAAHWAVARVDQPYRVAGRKAPAPASQLDAVVIDVVAWLRQTIPAPAGPLVLAGRSSGSRVACRIARQVQASAVIAFGFPLHPPGGRRSRQAELDEAAVPVLVVQGARDSFGRPRAARAKQRSVRVIAGADHVLRTRKADGRSEADVVDEAVALSCGWANRVTRTE